MNNPFKKTYPINFTEIIDFNFQITVFVVSLILRKKAFADVKPVMVSTINMPDFLKVWSKIENKANPLISIEAGKNNIVQLTESELTAYLKMIILVNKILSGRYFIFIKEELISTEKVVGEMEKGLDFYHRITPILIRMAKMRWRENKKFLAQIEEMENLVL